MPHPVLIENGQIRVRQCRHGLMTYLINDRFIGRSFDLYGEYSEGEVTMFSQILRPGNIVVEAGANIGAHTVALADLVGKGGMVIAFEPQRRVFQILCANLALNEIRNVRALAMGVGARAGRAVVPPVDYEATGNFGHVAMADQGPGEAVPVLTIDSLHLAACHLIKIDVEGMELEVLEGAVETIAKFRPRLYLENDRRDRSPRVIGKLFEMNYRVFWHLPPLFNAKNFLGLTENVFGNVNSVNLLAVPKEAKTTVMGLSEIRSVNDWWKATPSAEAPSLPPEGR